MFVIFSQLNDNYKTFFKNNIGKKLIILQGKTWSVVDRNRKHFYPYNLAFCSQVRLYIRPTFRGVAINHALLVYFCQVANPIKISSIQNILTSIWSNMPLNHENPSRIAEVRRILVQKSLWHLLCKPTMSSCVI